MKNLILKELEISYDNYLYCSKNGISFFKNDYKNYVIFKYIKELKEEIETLNTKYLKQLYINHDLVESMININEEEKEGE